MRRAAFGIGALAIALLASGVAARDGIRTIEVTIEHSLFVPSRIEVSPGETVRFIVHNTDPIDHEFLIGDTAVQLRHESGTEPHHGAKPGEISIPALQKRSTTYTFGEAGSSIFGCHLPLHYDYGMRGSIRIG